MYLVSFFFFVLFCFFYIYFLLFFFFFFFFQAEDGIRDLYVTGVQTCALPISHRCSLVIPNAGATPCAHDAAAISTSPARSPAARRSPRDGIPRCRAARTPAGLRRAAARAPPRNRATDPPGALGPPRRPMRPPSRRSGRAPCRSWSAGPG